MSKKDFPDNPIDGESFENWVWSESAETWKFNEKIEFDSFSINDPNIDFPDSPTDGQQVGPFVWNSEKSVWNWALGYYIPDFVEYVVVAGGGGGGGSSAPVQSAGGGGAGGYVSSVFGERSGGDNDPAAAIEFPRYSFSFSWPISVGAGGSGGSNANNNGTSGSPSSFADISVSGGGFGQSSNTTGTGSSGGSGGAGRVGYTSGGSGTSQQGSDGGPGAGFGRSTEADVYGSTGGGGGGGAGGIGYPGLNVGRPSDATQQGHLKQNSCSAASTGNVNLSSPPASIDGITLTEDMRVLIKDQTSQPENGIYVFSGGSLSRSFDMDQDREIAPGTWVEVTGGSTWANTNWAIERSRTYSAGRTIGTTPVVWEQSQRKPPGGGNGGEGIVSDITGSPVPRAGGGGGGGMGIGSSQPLAENSGVIYDGQGGTGAAGGGDGGTGLNAGQAASVNSGSGGGGSSVGNSEGTQTRAGGAGGSGVVVIRYPDIFPNLTIGTGLTYRASGGSNASGNGTAPNPSYTPPGYKVYQFNGGSGTVSLSLTRP